MFRVKLLYIALDPCLGRVLDKNTCFQKDVVMQFGLVRSIATNGVYRNTRTYQIVRQNGLISLVCCASGYDFCAKGRVVGRRARG